MAVKGNGELAMDALVAKTGLDRDELIDRAVVAALAERWVPDSEALAGPPAPEE